jgi:DNA-binding response OmpR family regulator
MDDEILIVDDDSVACEALARLLQLEGYRPACAGDGREALEAMRRHTPALVLLDVTMPDLNGLRLLDEMRHDPALRDVPVVMMSGGSEPDSVLEARRLGANDYLIKDRLSADQVIGRVRYYLPRPEQPSAARDAGVTRDT